MNFLKRLFIKQYVKLLPDGKFVLVLGGDELGETLNICKTILSEKLNILVPEMKNKTQFRLGDAFRSSIIRYKPKTDKILLWSNPIIDADMDEYLKIVNPGVFVFTQNQQVRTDTIKIKNFEILSRAISPDKGIGIFDYSDPLIRDYSEKFVFPIYYGFDKDNCHIWAGKVRVSEFKTVFELNYGVERVEVSTSLLGLSRIKSILAGAALATLIKFPLTTIKKGIEKIKQSEHRLEVLTGFNNSYILDDSFDATVGSILEGLEVLNQITARRRILVLGELRNLGFESEKTHREIAREIYRNKVDLVFLGGGDAQFIGDELLKLGFLEDRMERNLQNPQIVSKLLKTLLKGDIVFITGANGLKFEEIVKKLAR